MASWLPWLVNRGHELFQAAVIGRVVWSLAKRRPVRKRVSCYPAVAGLLVSLWNVFYVYTTVRLELSNYHQEGNALTSVAHHLPTVCLPLLEGIVIGIVLAVLIHRARPESADIDLVG